MEEIDIPSHFLCPISLQLMKDPVTISTGITYDRISIEEWFFSCKNYTCPLTKQPLLDTDLTPNHTLHRLIQSWCTLNASYGIERIPTPKEPIDHKAQIFKLINEAKQNHSLHLQCLTTLKSIALNNGRNIALLESPGTSEFLVSTIKKKDTLLIKEAFELLYHLNSSQSHLKNLLNSDNELLDSLVEVLNSGNQQGTICVMILLKSFFEDASPTQLLSVKNKLFSEIVHALKHNQASSQASKTGLKLLVVLCSRGRNRIKAVKAGVVFTLVEILLNSSERRVCELALVCLDQLCDSAEGRAELLEHGGGLAIVSKKILRVSNVASDKAIRILSSICRFLGTSRILLQELLEIGVVSKLCLVIQVDCCLKRKERVRDILKLYSSVWNTSSCTPSNLLSSYLS